MKVCIRTKGEVDIDLHDKIVDIINIIYKITEKGANGGGGYYYTHGETEYPHIDYLFKHKCTIGDVDITIESYND